MLLTSFDTWLPHQISNSSDDLLNQVAYHYTTLPSLSFLRKLPVDIRLASHLVVNKINNLQPQSVICCGMAESRSQLSVESTARCGDTVLKTLVNLPHLLADCSATEISHNAGKFVCEGLYYSVLNYINNNNLKINCIFIHVPILTEANSGVTLADFCAIIDKFRTLSP